MPTSKLTGQEIRALREVYTRSQRAKGCPRVTMVNLAKLEPLETLEPLEVLWAEPAPEPKSSRYSLRTAMRRPYLFYGSMLTGAVLAWILWWVLNVPAGAMVTLD